MLIPKHTAYVATVDDLDVAWDLLDTKDGCMYLINTQRFRVIKVQ